MYEYIPEGARVLDFGCSTGNFGEALEKLKNCTVVGVDINERDIAEAATRISEAYVFDITAADAEDKLGRFDVVVFADVLEHLGNPEEVLRAARGLLVDDGVIVYSIPHMGHVSVRLDLLEGRFPYSEIGLLDRTHVHFYDRIEVHDIFGAAGLAITDEWPTVSDYPPEWIRQRLSAIGLTTDTAFFDMLRSTEAHIFQFVGRAKRRTGEPVPPRTAKQFLIPADEILDRANAVVGENQRLAGELDELRTWVEALKKNPFRVVGPALRNRLRR